MPAVLHDELLRLAEAASPTSADAEMHLRTTLNADNGFNGRAGWFRDTCYGGTYDLTGELAFGPSPRGLDRLAISVRDGRVYVDTRAITPSASRPPPGYEFQYGAGLGPSSVPLGW